MSVERGGVDEVVGDRMGMEGAGLVAVTNQVDAVRMSERVDADAGLLVGATDDGDGFGKHQLVR